LRASLLAFPCIALGLAVPRTARAQSREFGEPMILPTFSVGIGVPNAWGSSPGTEASTGAERTQVPIWGGVAFHPLPATVSGFTAVGLEANLRSSVDGTHTMTEWIPEMRVGASITATENPKWADVLVPPFELYTLAGWRFASYERPAAARLGVGVSSPLAAIGVLQLARDSCVPPPTMVEAVWDLEPNHLHEFQFRVGWQF